MAPIFPIFNQCESVLNKFALAFSMDHDTIFEAYLCKVQICCLIAMTLISRSPVAKCDNHTRYVPRRQSGPKVFRCCQRSDQPFDAVLEFFNDTNRQRRMEESEIHHDRPPLSGVVRELESHPAIDRSLADTHTQRSKRLRQAVGVVVRMIMQARGWRKTGRKGSLGVRTSKNGLAPNHNTGGLAFWFIRAERYEREEGMPFPVGA
jgi:hypothetical protein